VSLVCQVLLHQFRAQIGLIWIFFRHACLRWLPRFSKVRSRGGADSSQYQPKERRDDTKVSITRRERCILPGYSERTLFHAQCADQGSNALVALLRNFICGTLTSVACTVAIGYDD
jgi:hypothetical protein